ncbi:N-acetylneuraminate synthase family protein [Candidatus Pelagibacter communis]|uniref:N-acetylneuraminate synthase family protein n=1 Tax=Pelagibacter ubique TaxID=198252 RepID=UPI00094BEEB9|nr:N-acetylneuraminate synthase family protein [Candidatus Pelagibacter ubique]
MKTNQKQRNVKIISEIHPQFMGSKDEIKRMILQSKLSGADYVKVQLYNSQKLFGNKVREFLEINFNELKELKSFSDDIGVKIFASIFDEEKIEWCEKLNFELYKIASRTVLDKKLCKKIISTKKKIIVSLGMYNYQKKGIPFDDKNIKYLYCVSNYPTNYNDIKMPNFDKSFFSGFSDHSVGIGACLFAVSRGAEYLEKHFSNNKSMNVNTQMAHICSMDSNELSLLRKYSDDLTLLRSFR